MPIKKREEKQRAFAAETDHEALKQALTDSEAIIEGLLEMSPYPVAVTRMNDGRFMWINRRYSKIGGYDPEQIIGRTHRELNLYLTHGDRERIIELLCKNGFVDKFETRLKTRDDRMIHAQISARPIKYRGEDCVLSITTYTSEISKAHQALRETENRYQNILNSITEGYYEVDLKGRFTFFNSAAVKLLGYSEQELMGMSYADYVAPKDLPKIQDAYNAVYREEAKVRFIEYAIRHKEGHWIQVEVSVSLLRDSDGNPIGFYGINRDRTRQKMAEEALRRSEEKYRNILEDMDEGYYETDLNGNITNFNNAMIGIHGYPPEELQGLSYKDYLGPEQARKNLDIFTTVYETGNSVRIPNYEIIRKDGSICYSEISAYPLKNHDGKTVGFWGITRDRTEQMRTEMALKKSEEHYRTLVENANDAIYITQQGRIKFHNRKTVELTGYPPHELQEMELYDLVHPDDEGVVYDLKMRRAETDEPPRLLYFRIVNPADKVLWVELSTVGITWEGRPATLCFMRDVTQQKKMETQLIQTRKMESIGTLAGGIAHDFNNILGSVIGFTELALEDAKPGTLMADNLQEVLIAGRRAKDLVRQILAFARQSEEKVERVEVSAIVAEALKLIRSTLPTTIEIKQNIASNSNVMGNATQIHQIVMNLCSNAAHAMEESGGILSIDLTDACFSKAEAGETLNLPGGAYLKLSIADTGCGISSEYLNTIFEPFFTTKGPGEGTGMGLSVVQGIVEKYGGRIGVASEIGKGTIFSIYLPVCPGEKSSRIEECDQPRFKSKRILLVDDEPGILKVSRQILSLLGYRVTPQQSSLKALEIFRKNPNAFDLVMTDMTMPGMTGDRLAREMLKIRPDIPVVLCTGYSKKINEKMAADMGIKALILKPIMKNQLASTIRDVLESV